VNAPLRLRLDPPWRVAAGSLVVRGTTRVREAVRIRLHDGHGHSGLGEALPLPGYSRDDADAAWRALEALAALTALTALTVPASGAGLALPQPVPGAGLSAAPGLSAAACLEAALAPHATPLAGAPSAVFALECALVDLLARQAGLSAARWLAGGRALQPVPVSVMLPEAGPAAVAAAAAAAARGHGVLKLKIGLPGRSAGDEDALLAAVRLAADAACPGAASPRLRLDANGAFDPAAAPARLAALARHGVELVEEPVAGAALLALPALALPWAADESLAEPALAAALLALPPARGPAALVLKPALLGLARCLRLAETAAQRGLGVIVTHAFDGDLGHAAACALAAALPRPPWACGLAPHAGLSRPLPVQPWLALPQAPGLGLDDAAGPR
jgi:L-alanine-DL-glutamate epimerase-like enolase superfamily enzyme